MLLAAADHGSALSTLITAAAELEGDAGDFEPADLALVRGFVVTIHRSSGLARFGLN